MSQDSGKDDLRLMVAEQIAGRGIRDQRVLDAMREIPRQLFVPEREVSRAFRDGPLEIGYGQTISQPFIVAYMTELLELRGTERVLEIGTGSGYQTAILARLAQKVFSVEVISALSDAARKKIAGLGFSNVDFLCGDGKLGWPERAPFDRVIVTAAAREFPVRLAEQLAEWGLMVWPQGDFVQKIYMLRNEGSLAAPRELIPVSFVPLV